jgi:hypothetical protein
MGTGKRRISTVEANAAKAKEELAPEVVILVRPIARVEELALVIDPVEALELAIALAAVRELEHVRVEAELELGPVEVEPELVRAAVALRTKSATGAHRQDLVRLLAAEASVVAGVETSLAPAAAEAATAWVAVE